MQAIKWHYYPYVAAHPTARAFIESQARRQKSPKTVDAYARNVDDLMQAFDSADPDRFINATLEDIEGYVDGLSTRLPRTAGHKAKITRITKTKLSPATIQQRIVTARLFFDFCIVRGQRSDQQNPVPRGSRGIGDERPRRGPFVRRQRLAWIPPDDVWERIVTHVVLHESLRDQLLVLLAYEGALRRQELLGLRRDDLDLGAGLVTIRPELSKTGIRRTVTFSSATGLLLTRYLGQDRAHLLATFGGVDEGPLFLSESQRNPGVPLAIGAFNDVIARIRRTLNVPQLTPHTLRHLRLTVLQRSNVDLQDIALYAGHASVASTQIYLHMAPTHLARRIAAALAPYDRRLTQLVEEAGGT
jgi:integrase/recombinase XerD